MRTIKYSVIKAMQISVFVALFCTSKMYSQYNDLKYRFGSTDYFSKAVGLVVRYDKIIDSIYFPVDTSKIKVDIKKLNIKGKKATDSIVFYQYMFTPKIKGKYLLPKAIVYSKNNKFPIICKDTLSLYIPNKKERESTNSYSFFKTDGSFTITSRLKTKSKKINFLNWIDKDNCKVGEVILFVIESRKGIDNIKSTLPLSKAIQKNITLYGVQFRGRIENGIEYNSYIYKLKAIKKGKVTIPPFTLKIGNKNFKTKKLKFRIN